MFSLLYVDDEPGLLEIGKLFLEGSGDFIVTPVLSGEEALAELLLHSFDAIVSDYQMPEMDGLDLLKTVRKSYGNVPFILFTGRGREEVVIEAINNGVDFYLQKGGDPRAQFAELAHKVRQAVTRRKAEVALSDSERRLADIIDFLPDATFAIDTEGKVIAWNRAIEEMTGVAAKDMLGKGDYEYSLPFYGKRRPILIDLIFEPDEKIAQGYSNIRRDGNSLSGETNLPHPKGEQIYVLAKATPLYNREGEVTGAIETIRDVTEKRRGEEALNESERRFRELAELLPQGIYEADVNGRMVYVNRHGLEMYGYDAGDIENGLNVISTIIPDDREQAAMAFRQMAEQGVHITGGRDYHALRKDGSTFPVSIYSSPILRDGRIVGVRGILVDITNRQKSEEELRAVNEQLAASGEELQAQYDVLAEGERRIREREARLNFMIGFYEYAQKSERELLDYAVEGAGIITGSPLGYLAFMNDDESELSMYAWSKAAMAECSMRDKPIVYKTEKTGLWGDAVRLRRPVITNDYAAPNPGKRGYPDGHPVIVRHMNVPVIDDGHVVLVSGVANKPSDYTEQDARELVLLMQGLWMILKRKRAEKKRRESEERYRKIIEHSPIGMHFFELMPDGSLVFTGANPGADAILGVKNDRFIGKTIETAFPGLVNTEVPAQYRRVAESGGSWQKDQVLYDAGKVHRAYSFTAFQISFGLIVAMFVDITERTTMVDALRTSEQNYRILFETATEGILIAQGDRLVHVNPALIRLLEQPAEVITSRPFTEFIHPDDREMVMSRHLARMRGATPQTGYMFRIVTGKGHERWVWISSDRITWSGKPASLSFLTDMTEQKKAEESLVSANREYMNLLNQIQDIYYRSDTEGRLVKASRSWATLLGYNDISECLGRNIADDFYFNPADREQFVEITNRDGKVTNYEVQLRRKDGTPVVVATNSHVYRDPEGNVLGIEGTFRDITDRKKTEKELRESEEKFRKLIIFVPVPLSYATSEGTIEFINTRFTELFGYTHEDIPTLTDWFNRAYPDPGYRKQQRERWDAAVKRASERGSDIERFEYHVTCKDGSVRNVLIGGITIEGRLLATFIDFTEQRKAEEALRQSEEKYRLIAENSPDMIYSVDTGGYVRYVNPVAGQAMNAEPESLVGKHLSEIFKPEIAQHHMDAIRRVIETRISFNREMFEDLPSGGAWIDVRLNPIIDTADRVIGVIGLSHDISDRKHAEEAIRESEEKYRLLVENTHDIIYLISPDGILTFVSPSWADLLGHNPRDVEGTPFRQYVHPADVPVCEAALTNVVSSGQRMSGIEYRIFHADGSIRVHTSTVAPIFDKTGAVLSYVGNARDITEMKQFQNAIRESNRKLNLLSSITRHDVANQLTVVQGYTQLAALKKPDPVIADFLAKISSAVDMIQHQIEFTRTYQDLGVEAPAWFRIRDVIDEARPEEIALDFTCGSCEIFADPMIGKVFFNLFDNAVRYGERVTTVTVRCSMAGDELIITFADNGVGIPLNEKAKIFEKGFGKHTGFGLFLVREILAITGISIHETGTHGKGARFEIAVPKGTYRSVET